MTDSTTTAFKKRPSRMRELSDAVLQELIREDVPYGDLTTRMLGLGDRPARMDFRARAAMRVAGTEEAARLVELAGGESADVPVPSGGHAQPGDLLLRAQGSAQSLLVAWKVAQTLVEAASGIATATARIVEALRLAGHPHALACTRKNMPGTRALAAKAVHAGGGVMHRLGLSETILVFPEHRAFIDASDWPSVVAILRAATPEKKIVVEVGDADDALMAARLGVDVLQLERFSPDALRALRTRLDAEGLRPLLAPAGGVTLANAVAYAEAGADMLVSSSPYFAPPADVKVLVEPA